MTDYADLRTQAEQMIVDEDVAAILDLLNSLVYQQERDDLLLAAERRVAALEELLRSLTDDGPWVGWDSSDCFACYHSEPDHEADCAYVKARALLQPSEAAQDADEGAGS